MRIQRHLADKFSNTLFLREAEKKGKRQGERNVVEGQGGEEKRDRMSHHLKGEESKSE